MTMFDSMLKMEGGSQSKINGVVVGIVSNNQDPEGLARVKLKLPVREGENETDWARIATLMAGKDRGSLFIPEVGDEVLVAFHLGEVRQPYVIGTLWSDKHPSPKGNDKNDIRKIKSRAGHEIIFDDNDKEGKITIKTKDGQIVEMDDKTGAIKIAEKSGNNAIEITGGSKNEVTIKSSQSVVKMTTKGDISVESVKSVKLKSTQISIEATGTLDIKAAMVNISADGMLNIKGSMVKIN